MGENVEESFITKYNHNSYLGMMEIIVKGLYEQGKTKSINQELALQYQLSFNYYNNKENQACTETYGNCDYLIINSGLIYDFYAYFMSVFSSKYYFSDLGDAKKEKGKIVDGRYSSKDNCIYLTGKPSDSKREMLAIMTAQMACSFVANHELGHLFNGHTTLLREKYGVNKINMFDDEKTHDKELALLRRTLEWDADSFAATRSADNLLETYVQVINNEDRQILEYVNSPLDMVKMWSFAIHSVFMMFKRINHKKYSRDSYYVPEICREKFAYAAFIDTVKDYCTTERYVMLTENIESIEKYIVYGINEADDYYNSRYNEESNYFEESKKIEYNDILKELNEYWDMNLKQRLKPYARAVLFDSNMSYLYK